MKAMILAAGQGSRVRPLTLQVPKPMIPLLGQPLMAFLVDHLRKHGFTQIVVNTSYLAPQIEEYFRDGARFGVEMAFSFEGALDADGLRDIPRGSAGGLRYIQDFSGFFDSTFVVLCGDALIDVNLTAALRHHRARGAIATIVTTQVPPDRVSSYGIVVTDERGRVQSFQEKPAAEEARGTSANTGIYIFEPEVFRHIPSGQAFDFGSQLFPKLVAAQAPLYALDMPFQWIDIGTTADYWQASMQMLRGEIGGVDIPGTEIAPGIHVGVNVRLPARREAWRGPIWLGGSTRVEDDVTMVGPVAIGPGSIVEAGATIERSVIWDHTRVTGYAELRECIVSGGYCVSRSGASVSIAATQLEWILDDARRLPRGAEFELEAVVSSLRGSS